MSNNVMIGCIKPSLQDLVKRLEVIVKKRIAAARARAGLYRSPSNGSTLTQELELALFQALTTELVNCPKMCVQ